VFVIRYEPIETSNEWEPFMDNFEAVATDIVKSEELIQKQKKKEITVNRGAFGSLY
jgi:hypothetical protein